jgi:hypothetical protein
VKPSSPESARGMSFRRVSAIEFLIGRAGRLLDRSGRRVAPAETRPRTTKG